MLYTVELEVQIRNALMSHRKSLKLATDREGHITAPLQLCNLERDVHVGVKFFYRTLIS